MFVPASIARKRVGRMLDKVSSSPTVFIITRYRKPSVVILGVDQYNYLFPKSKVALAATKKSSKR